MPTIFPTPPWPDNGTNYGQCLSVFLRPVSLALPEGGSYVATIFDMGGGMVSGRQALSEAIARRLVTYRGTLIDDPNYGFDVRQYVNDDLGPRDLAVISSGVEAEATKDDRVLRATCSTSLVSNVLIIALTLTDQKGPFKLVLSVSQVTVSILQVGT